MMTDRGLPAHGSDPVARGGAGGTRAGVDWDDAEQVSDQTVSSSSITS